MASFRFKAIVLFLSIMAGSVPVFSQQDLLQKAWASFNQNNRVEALKLFGQAIKDPGTKSQAALGLCLVNYNNQAPQAAFENLLTFYQADPDPYPYIYALWSTDVLAGGSKENDTKAKLDFYRQLSTDPRANATLRAMAWSALGNYAQSKNDYKTAREDFSRLQVLDQWEITGKFDNISGSGFNKDFGPVAHPEADAEFKNYVGATVKWFPVKSFRNDRWLDFTYHFSSNDAIAYAQTFVNSPVDQEAVLMSGVSGSVKVFVNDKIVISEDEERNTDMDVYNSAVHLNKGYNRILVQIGSSEISNANFMIRLTDTDGRYLQDITCTAASQPYQKENRQYMPRRLPLFAEQYFTDRLKQQPGNFADEFMLAETYLRSEKTYEARKILTRIREQAPLSSYVSLLLIRTYGTDGNNTDETREEEFLKKNDPDNYQSLLLNWKEAMQKEDYAAAEKVYQQMVDIYGNGLSTTLLKLAMEGTKNDVNAFIRDLDDNYEKYPDNYYLASAKYTLAVKGSNDLRTANGILEKYLAHNDNEDFRQMLIANCFTLGDKATAEKYMDQSMENKPYATGFFNKYATIYFGRQDYRAALKWQEKTLAEAPYIGDYYKSIGIIQEALKDKKAAADAYHKCIYYAPTNYEAREKLRELDSKSDMFDKITAFNTDSLYLHAPDSSAYPNDNSIVLLNDKQRIVYGGGASEEKVTMLAKVFNQSGIDDWKETGIDYNPYSQRLIVEKAEVLKKDGSKVKAEVNDGDLVFTSIEPGDGVIYTYRIENYNSGRLAQHFWDDFYFNMFIPVENARYTLITPVEQTLNYKVINASLKPTVKTADGWKTYTWETRKAPAIQNEHYMPRLSDIGQRLEVSSIPSWNFIQSWYSDLSSTKAKSDFEIKEITEDLFRGKTGLTELQKAKIIYAYIVQHINYSDVSFLHSAFTPQRASRTLNTRLGDCKDLATLFVAMAKEEGLKANLILIDTRDNGDRHLLLPSVNFNHCIACVMADGKKYVVELTSPYLPFGALTWNLRHTSGLYIPRDGQAGLPDSLVKLHSATDVPEMLVRHSDITFEGKDMHILRKSYRTGSEAAGIRSSYVTLGQEDRIKSMSSSISGDFTTTVILDSLWFGNLDNLKDTVSYDMGFTVKDDLSQIAGMDIFRLPWADAVGSLSFLSQQGMRQFPFALWALNFGKEMKETIVLHIPEGKKLAEVPKDVQYSCGILTYNLSFKVSPEGLVATRVLDINGDEVAPSDFNAFKQFFTDVSNADSKQYGIR
ncbi:MAG TPA: DUF3857 domain-containing protein [Edaphocola sp.]|nr:DUF3857 domain-containing protein [Edaphocola sp.]